MIDAEFLRITIAHAGVKILPSDLDFVVRREQLRPPTQQPAHLTEPALIHRVARRNIRPQPSRVRSGS